MYCTEYCGTAHSDMLGKVHVLSKAKFASWEDGSADKALKASAANIPPAELGKQLYSSKGCVACHSIDGADGVGPTWKGLFGKEREFTDGTKFKVNDVGMRRGVIVIPLNHDQLWRLRGSIQSTSTSR